MAEKTLTLNKIYCLTIYNNLRSTPSKDYPTTEEVKETIELLPKLKEQAQGYVDILKIRDDIYVEYKKKLKGLSEDEAKLVQEELNNKINEINEKIAEYSLEHAKDVCELKLSEDSLKVLKTQFERNGWGAKWVASVEEFGEILLALEEAGK